MNTTGRQNLLRLLLVAIIFIAGCAHNTKPRSVLSPQTSYWQGRLVLRVHSTPEQILSAHFDLQGNPQMGSLRLATPLGTALADMQWNTHTATLHSGDSVQQFDSLPALVRHATGTDVPIASLFAWLQGTNLPTPGWQVDLSDMASGRLSAQRVGVDTPADLKIIIDP